MSTAKLDELNQYLEEECRELTEKKRAHIWVLAHNAVCDAIPAFMWD
jgi:hypothetical protein